MHQLAAGAMALLFGATLVVAAPQQTYDVASLDLPAQTVLVVKGKEETKKLGAAIKVALGKVEAFMKARKIAATGAPLTKTLVYKQGTIEFQSGFPVAKGQKGEGDVEAIELPAGSVAKTLHTGPQDKSPYAYEALHQWMIANKKKTSGQPWEVYAGPRKLEVYYPIKDKK